ncbi:MAG: DUF302 domain-containing protein [Myxococcales bacterium]|nr:DUF302 domain-containing protein [Myxococcales bacterium]
MAETRQSEGFGVLTEIGVQRELSRTVLVFYRKNRILGACNPTLAHCALSAKIDANAAS